MPEAHVDRGQTKSRQDFMICELEAMAGDRQAKLIGPKIGGALEAPLFGRSAPSAICSPRAPAAAQYPGWRPAACRPRGSIGNENMRSAGGRGAGHLDLEHAHASGENMATIRSSNPVKPCSRLGVRIGSTLWSHGRAAAPLRARHSAQDFMWQDAAGYPLSSNEPDPCSMHR